MKHKTATKLPGAGGERAKARSQQRVVRAHIAKIIQDHVGYFNGWHVHQNQEELDCLDAAYAILAYLRRKKLVRSNEKGQR